MTETQKLEKRVEDLENYVGINSKDFQRILNSPNLIGFFIDILNFMENTKKTFEKNEKFLEKIKFKLKF